MVLRSVSKRSFRFLANCLGDLCQEMFGFTFCGNSQTQAESLRHAYSATSVCASSCGLYFASILPEPTDTGLEKRRWTFKKLFDKYFDEKFGLVYRFCSLKHAWTKFKFWQLHVDSNSITFNNETNDHRYISFALTIFSIFFFLGGYRMTVLPGFSLDMKWQLHIF